MKKIVTLILTSLILFSMTFQSTAEAAPKLKTPALNYLSKTTAKKIMQGKITGFDGIKYGDKLSKFVDSKYYSQFNYYDTMKYYYKGDFTTRTAFSDFYLELDPKKMKVTRFVDNVSARKYKRTSMLKLYGNPKKNYSLFYAGNLYEYKIDIYKNVTFVYKRLSNKYPYELDRAIHNNKEIANNLSKYRMHLKNNIFTIDSTDLDNISLSEWNSYY